MASTGTCRPERRQPGSVRAPARARPNLRGARLAPLALIVLLACSEDGSAPTEIAAVDDAPRIDFTIALRWDDLEDRIRAAVTVVNRDALGRDVIFPTCNPTIDILDPEDGRLVWSERRWQAATMSCRPFGPTITVMPGVTIAVEREVRDRDGLGDSLPAGTYRAVIRFAIDHPDDEVIVSVRDVRLGLP